MLCGKAEESHACMQMKMEEKTDQRPNKIPTCTEHGRTKRTNVLRLKKIPTYIEQDRIKYQQPTHPTNGLTSTNGITFSNYGRASALTTTTQPLLPNILATKEVLVIINFKSSSDYLKFLKVLEGNQ